MRPHLKEGDGFGYHPHFRGVASSALQGGVVDQLLNAITDNDPKSRVAWIRGAQDRNRPNRIALVIQKASRGSILGDGRRFCEILARFGDSIESHWEGAATARVLLGSRSRAAPDGT